jgi:hypothetical protein
MAGQFQPEAGSNTIFTAEEVGNLVVIPTPETPLGPIAPSTIFDENKPIHVRMTVKFAESFANWVMTLPLRLTFTVQAESQGAGFEGQIGTHTISTTAGQFQYTGDVPCPGGLPAGVYQLTCVMTTKVGNISTEIVGFDEVLVQAVHQP